MTDRQGVPLSVLDLAVVREGGTTASALAETTTLAQQAERLGYRRFWVAEHHNMPTVASTNPAVLIAHLAANTATLRIGSGGVMLPNYCQKSGCLPNSRFPARSASGNRYSSPPH